MSPTTEALPPMTDKQASNNNPAKHAKDAEQASRSANSPNAKPPWRRVLVLLPAAIAVMVGLAACGSSSSTSATSASSGQGAGKATQGGTIYYAGEQEPPCLGRP